MIAPIDATIPRFTVRLDRRTINVRGKSSRHLVVGVAAPAVTPVAGRPRIPLDLGLVIDASGSMQGENLAAAKAAAIGIIDALDARDHLSIVSFASDTITHLEPTAMTEAGRRAARRAIEPLTTRGSTNLEEGWLVGAKHLARRQAETNAAERHHLILLSDGHANEGVTDPAVLAERAARVREGGVLTSTVGVGLGYSPAQLQAIAEAGGGRMHDAETPAEIVEVVMAELQDTVLTAVEGLVISLRLPAGAKAEVHGTAPTTSGPGRFDVLLGSLRSGAVRDVVVRLELPEGRAGDRLAVEGTARWRLPGAEVEAECRLPGVELVFGSPGECERQPIDREVATIAAEHWRSGIYHRGVALNQDGGEEEARRFVEDQLQRFRRYCGRVEGLEPLVESIETFHSSLRRRYDALAAKEVMFHAYKQLRCETDHRSAPRKSVADFVRSQDKEP